MRNLLKMVLSAVCQGQSTNTEGGLLSEQGRDITAEAVRRQAAASFAGVTGNRVAFGWGGE